jgi:hypothetical protein
MTTATDRPVLEVAAILHTHGAAFLKKYGGLLTATQKKALRDLAACRTATLGGHVERCLDCDHQHIAYNSCRNRHCPKCQALTRARWLTRESENLLSVEYHHVVFTLPAEVAELALANEAVLYEALFAAASATLREVAANPKRLGAQLGVLLVLHTWGQNLHHHPHVHGIVTGGGLSCNPQGIVDANPSWVSCRPGFFLPVRVLSRVFRGQYLKRLRTAFVQGQLRLPGQLAHLAQPGQFAQWLRPLCAKEWVVYAKRPFGGPRQVLAYLAGYTHRVAISNGRLVSVVDGRVTFRYKDYADGHRSKTMTLSAEEFLRRFVQHVLPKGFVKMRHYGLVANCRREEKLRQCRQLLLPFGAATATAATETILKPVTERCCPQCGSHRLRVCALPRGALPVSAGGNTS